MAKALFHLVDQIRSTEKYCDASKDDLRRLLMTTGKCHVPTEVDVNDDGESMTVELRLNINTRAPHPLAWTMSLKLHDILIDCVDFETKYALMGGGIGRGWHRHQWDAAEETAKRNKLPAPELDGVASREEFILRVLNLFNVRVNTVSHGQPDLQFT